jgi:hypothetical protein
MVSIRPFLASSALLVGFFLIEVSACGGLAVETDGGTKDAVVGEDARSRDVTMAQDVALDGGGPSEASEMSTISDSVAGDTFLPTPDSSPASTCHPDMCAPDQYCVTTLTPLGSSEVGSSCQGIPSACEPERTCACIEGSLLGCAKKQCSMLDAGQVILTCTELMHP